MDLERLRAEAWVGDAVLALYARLRILRDDGKLDGEKCIRMTSNQFLAGFGEPTAVEAELGRVFQTGGLEPAFAWIETRLMPLFDKQEANRKRKGGQRG
jgi:dsRNA-specific ribonuclease